MPTVKLVLQKVVTKASQLAVNSELCWAVNWVVQRVHEKVVNLAVPSDLQMAGRTGWRLAVLMESQMAG